jgi:hypothetical protein
MAGCLLAKPFSDHSAATPHAKDGGGEIHAMRASRPTILSTRLRVPTMRTSTSAVRARELPRVNYRAFALSRHASSACTGERSISGPLIPRVNSRVPSSYWASSVA